MDRQRAKLPPVTALRPFEAAARLGGFTKAAEELNLTQAAVSHQIRNLEEDLGRRLFERRNRMAVLTEDGQAFAHTVAEALDGIAAHAGRLRGGRRTGEVILFAQLCEAMYWVMPRLGAFRRRMPDVHVNVVSSTQPLSDYDGEFDIALQTAARDAGGLRPALTVPDEVFPLCSPSFLNALPTPPTLETLADLPLLHHKAHPSDWLDWDGWFARAGCDRRVGDRGRVFDDYLFMIQAAIEGQGITLGWGRTMCRLIDVGALTRLTPDRVVLSDGLSVYYRPFDRARPEVASVLDWLQAELETPP